jgi:hypothetical protein
MAVMTATAVAEHAWALSELPDILARRTVTGRPDDDGPALEPASS